MDKAQRLLATSLGIRGRKHHPGSQPWSASSINLLGGLSLGLDVPICRMTALAAFRFQERYFFLLLLISLHTSKT